MRVIVNPYATTTSPALRELVVHGLSDKFIVEATDTEGPGHATELARQAVADGVDVLAVLGGDGTVNEAANGLVGSDVVLAALPGGATNVYHRILGMPRDIVDATNHLLHLADDWQPRSADLGRIGERYFTFAAGVGLDASVVRKVDAKPKLKSSLGPWYFAYSGVATFLNEYAIKPPKVVLETDTGVRLEGITAVIQNATEFTYFSSTPIRLFSDVEVDSGLMSGAMIQTSRPTIMPGVIHSLLSSGKEVDSLRTVSGARNFRSGRIFSADDRELPFQVDGDYVGTAHELEIAVEPGALRVVG